MDVAVIIPWRDKGSPRRRANLRRVLAHMADWDCPVHTVSDGREEHEPFGRQRAYNLGIAEHPADVWVFYEADMLVDHEQIDTAVEWAAEKPGLVIPFDVRHELGPGPSIDVAAGAPPTTYEPEHSYPRSYGAVNVVSAETMQAVGQWDEKLNGHGYDDTAMATAFAIATQAEPRYVPGPAWHLWHRQGFSPWEMVGPHADPANYPPEDVAATQRNAARLEKYWAATTPEQIRALTSGEA